MGGKKQRTHGKGAKRGASPSPSQGIPRKKTHVRIQDSFVAQPEPQVDNLNTLLRGMSPFPAKQDPIEELLPKMGFKVTESNILRVKKALEPIKYHNFVESVAQQITSCAELMFFVDALVKSLHQKLPTTVPEDLAHAIVETIKAKTSTSDFATEPPILRDSDFVFSENGVPDIKKETDETHGGFSFGRDSTFYGPSSQVPPLKLRGRSANPFAPSATHAAEERPAPHYSRMPDHSEPTHNAYHDEPSSSSLNHITTGFSQSDLTKLKTSRTPVVDLLVGAGNVLGRDDLGAKSNLIAVKILGHRFQSVGPDVPPFTTNVDGNGSWTKKNTRHWVRAVWDQKDPFTGNPMSEEQMRDALETLLRPLVLANRPYFPEVKFLDL